MIIPIINNWTIPTKANSNDAWYDLYTNHQISIPKSRYSIISTWISINIPKGYYGRICPRSWLAVKHGIDVLAWVIDSWYTWEIKVCLVNHWDRMVRIEKWDRIAQLIIQKFEDVERQEVTEHEDSNRWHLWFWSSGN